MLNWTRLPQNTGDWKCCVQGRCVRSTQCVCGVIARADMFTNVLLILYKNLYMLEEKKTSRIFPFTRHFHYNCCSENSFASLFNVLTEQRWLHCCWLSSVFCCCDLSESFYPDSVFCTFRTLACNWLIETAGGGHDLRQTPQKKKSRN